jgi:hypothetical protein
MKKFIPILVVVMIVLSAINLWIATHPDKPLLGVCVQSVESMTIVDTPYINDQGVVQCRFGAYTSVYPEKHEGAWGA